MLYQQLETGHNSQVEPNENILKKGPEFWPNGLCVKEIAAVRLQN